MIKNMQGILNKHRSELFERVALLIGAVVFAGVQNGIRGFLTG